ncbi:MAG: NAD-glutamate dehydrogenase [Armatimonadota bacterium]
MATKLDEAKAELIDKVTAFARGKIRRDQDATVEAFVRQYYGGVAPDDLVERTVIDLYGAAVAHLSLARQRTPGTPRIRVYTPEFDEHGWQSTHTVVEIVTDDMPFLVDSVSMELNRHGCGIHLVVHPIMHVRRDPAGELVEVLTPDASVKDAIRESFIHVEVDRQTEAERPPGLRADLERVLGDVRAAVEDWKKILAKAREIIAGIEASPPPLDPEEVAEAKALLQWMVDDHFTFLGYREYDLVSDGGEETLRAAPDSGLGILRETRARPVSHSFARLPPEVRRKARERQLLNLTKANSRATVHRATYLDYVGVKRFDASGEVIGERRFLGLYTSVAYNTSPREIPLLRRKVAAVIRRAGFPPASHSGKDLMAILESFPRDELFQISEDELFEIATGILQLQERRRVRLFVRRDSFGRFVSCQVYIPRDRYTTDVRLRIQEILQEAFHGTSVEYTVRVSESILARLHVIMYTDPGQVPAYDVREIEARLAEATRSWTDDLQDALVEQCGEERGVRFFRRFGEAFPAAYREDFSARTAVADIKRIEDLSPDGDLGMSLYHPIEARDGFVRFKVFRSGRSISLSDVLPLFQNMGVTVLNVRPYEVRAVESAPVWIYDFSLGTGEAALATGEVKEIFQDAFARVWRGEIENDGFNRLVLLAGLTSRQVTILRAYSKYLRQIGTTFSQSYMEETLARNPQIARRLAELFQLRFDPRGAHAGPDAARIAAEIETDLDGVASLDEDRILRNFLHLTQATLRTNYFQKGADGRPKPYLSVKLDPSRVPDLPRPRPMFEIFVYSPRMEGVHLRGGKVARGGIRWSDRREDFRTEILGLMKAQTVKNAVIVPVGAKGGFVLKQPPTGGDREALMREGVACYRTLISGLLDLSDNLMGGKVIPPPDVVRYDGDDPYLVVAADKGTATFSDIANAISAEYGFWLGDAFASGGSSGYDHKKMAITARGAWESVKRHFRELGIDIHTTDFTAVGIGDMSGDVFGNGMLYSRHLKLVAAFDHRHIFLDPNPDPEASFKERERLFGLPRSSWGDYDKTVLSPGGGVFPRTAKSVPLSPEIRRALDVDAAALTPHELIRAVLKAPVDLLYNGGIGTYVKAHDESHADVGDKANDAVRIDATELRCRAVCEGGNLGLTQRGRIEYALGGGLINTDAIDNSAGVDCSDHEVNIKILLDAVVTAGDMTAKQRNALLAEMTDEVAELVLRDNIGQTRALANARAQAASMLDVHGRYIVSLEQAGRLDRAIEFLPDTEALAERKAAGLGLTTPELAVLLAYTKIVLFDDVLASDVPEDPHLSSELERYFPTPLRDRFRGQMQSHRLRREIIATCVTNRMVNQAGISFAFRLAEETTAGPPDIARAHAVARDVFAMPALSAEIAELDHRIAAGTQTAMVLEGRRLVERATRWLLRYRRRPLDIAALVSFFSPGAAALAERLPTLLVGADRETLEDESRRLVAEGVPERLAARVAGFGPMSAALDLVEIAHAAARPIESVAATYFSLGDRLLLHWLRDRISALPRGDRWQALARVSLRDDLYATQRAITADVLRTGAPEMDANAHIDAWIAQNRAQVEHSLQVLGDIKSAGTFNLATLSVALREIRNLVRRSE